MVSLSLIAHRHRRSLLAFAALFLTCIAVLGVGASLSVAQTGAQSVLRDLPTGTSSTLSCSIDSYSTVVGADWLRVHVSPAASSPAVGQIPKGAIFHFCSTSGRNSGGHYWVYGWGEHGSTRLNGWVAGEYLAWP